jgi:outer membrane lipoprotein SlyB
LLSPFDSVAEAGIFDTLKAKSAQKIEELKQRDWWLTKIAGKVAGFVAGKAGGAIGAACGYVIGAACGGPVAAGMGAMIGFRIGDIITKTLVKPIGEQLATWKLKDQKKIDFQAVKDAIKSVNKASLTAEGIGAVVGDLIGGTMGAAAGIALLAGTGAWAIPLLGTVSAAYLGSKLGKWIFGGIGRWIGKKVLKKGYEAYAGSERSASDSVLLSDENEEAALEERINTVNIVGADNQEIVVSDEIQAKRLAYEQYYREYTDSVTRPDSDPEKVKTLMMDYRQAYEEYKSAVKKSEVK